MVAMTIREEINKLKEEKNAIILAHYYAPGEVQELADYVGDSYYLAKVATTTNADVVVFAGVSFMGESVKILNPEKAVLMPDITADCPMAHMAHIDRIEELRKQYEDLAVVCYINSTAKLKCHSDVCVTSSNAVKIVKNLPNKNIFFIPDVNLGSYVAKQVPDKNIILNDGYCPIHNAVTIDDILEAKKRHPKALVLTHPECKDDILKESDFIGSTADILKYATESECKEYIICTEEGVSYPLMLNNPDKKFYFAKEEFCCKDMKLNTVEKVIEVLTNMTNEVVMEESIRERAMAPLNKMLDMAK